MHGGAKVPTSTVKKQGQAFVDDQGSSTDADHLASHAAVALADAQQVKQLRKARQSRDVIGQAKGILMERYKITGHQAFLLLAKASQHSNKKLQALAEDLIDSGDLGASRT